MSTRSKPRFRPTNCWSSKSTRAGRRYARFSVFRSLQTEFPNLNDRAHIKKVIQGVINGMYVTLAGYAAVAALLLYGAYRLLL